MTKKLVCVTDCPTPYRLHLFEILHQELLSRGLLFEVLFTSITAPGRFWRCDPNSLPFPCRIVFGLHPVRRGIAFHLNPGIIWSVLKTRPTWLLIGGGWHIPTSSLLAVIASVSLRNTCVILWSEANYASALYEGGLVAAFRRFIMQRADVFAVPGQVAETTIRDIWKIEHKAFIRLPNLVDEDAYGTGVQDLRLRRQELRRRRGLQNDDLLLLWPARLHEQTKGILNFLRTIEPVYANNRVKILIAGEGPDRGLIEKWLTTSKMSGVQLLGQQSEPSMIELFAIADALLLPSLRDPNPLSVIEGLWAGLPLLISNRCGNWPEAIEQGKNGWMIDPASSKSIQTAFTDLIRKSSSQLAGYGHVSLALARERFVTESCVRAFVDALVNLPDCQARPQEPRLGA
jgi:glycosyltransferase involved in cell wall biosynthesis